MLMLSGMSFLLPSLQSACLPGTVSAQCTFVVVVIVVVVVDIVQSLSGVQLFATPRTAAHQASLSFTISQSLRKLMSIESVMPSNHLVLCHPVLLLPSIFPSIRVFSNDLALTLQTLPTESSTVRNKRFYCAH